MAYPALGSLFEGVVKGYGAVSGIIRDAQANEWHSLYMKAWFEDREAKKKREAKVDAAPTTPITQKAGTGEPTAPVAPTPALTKPTTTPVGSGSKPASALPVDTRVIDPANLINPAPPPVTGPRSAPASAPATAPATAPASTPGSARVPIPTEITPDTTETLARGIGVGSALDVNNPPSPGPQQPWITNEAPRDIGAALRAFWAQYGRPPGGAPGYQTGGAGGVYPAPQLPFSTLSPIARQAVPSIPEVQGPILYDRSDQPPVTHHTNRTALPVPAQGERPMRYDPATGQLVPW